MPYLTKNAEILSIITQIASAKTLWVDTETADWQTSHPKVSLIQVLADPTDMTGDRAYILDVLDQPDLVTYFVNQIMVNPNIEKVFHNAAYDVSFLGKEQARHITCTWKMAKRAKKTSDYIRQLPNLKLKTLAEELCHFSNVDKAEQSSNWARRPLTESQLQYAKMDTVYLAQVHLRLLEIINQSNPDSNTKIVDMVANGSKQPTQKSENSSFSVTKVRVAFECPRLFYLKHRFDGNTLFLPPDTAIGIGSAFHQLADKFVSLAQQETRFGALFEPAPQHLNVEEVASQMQQLFYQLAFFPYLQATSQKNPSLAPALLQLWEGLKGLIRRWAELLVVNRRYSSAEAVIRKTFVTLECSIEHDFNLPDGTQQRIVGEFDSLIFNLELQRLCVVEYKTYQPVDPSAQLAQVALYSYMLSSKNKVPVDSAVYCVLPEFKEYHFSWEQLENTVHQLIPHKLQQMRQWLTWEPPQLNPPPPTTQPYLCKICPQQQKCQSFFNVAGNSSKDVEYRESSDKHEKDTTHKQDKGGTVDADAIGKQLVETLQSFKIGVDYHGAAVGPAFIRVKLKPHLGVRINALLKLSADLQVQLGLANPPLIAPQAGYVSVDLPRSDRQIARFEEYIQRQNLPPSAHVKIAIGVDLDGQLVEADLSDPNTCHFLVGGTTGSGKSEFLRSLLLSLLVRHSPNHLKIALVDPKRVTFPEFENMRWLYSPVVKDSDRAIELMDELVAEMESRYRRFEATGCADLGTYNQRATQPLPRIVCIFDEYADFMAEKEIRNGLELSIKRLGAMARAGGIHLIIATQRPEAKVVTPIIRSNLPGRVALRTASEADSAIVLGGQQTAGAYLLGKGDLLYQVGSQLNRLQSVFAATIELS